MDEDSKVATDEDAIRKALDIAFFYGGIQGDHHRTWTIDQMVRALTAAPLHEGTYEDWIEEYRIGEDGQETYEWDEGIAP